MILTIITEILAWLCNRPINHKAIVEKELKKELKKMHKHNQSTMSDKSEIEPLNKLSKTLKISPLHKGD